MEKKLRFIFWILLTIPFVGRTNAQNLISFDKYHTNTEVRQLLTKLQQNNPALTQLHQIATSPGGEEVILIEIGKNNSSSPGIFVGANFEGNVPLATEGALYLAKMLVDSSKYTSGLRWYILPLPNPDAAKCYFSGIKYERSVNDLAINNDVDDAVNEDGCDDLNGDNLITQMRVKDLTGTYLISKIDSRIMVQADPKKGERGEYRIYSEGLDNDGDGEYNEDGEGGINVGISFPHLFPKNKKEAGLWPGQTPEVYQLMKFIFDRPNIAMAFTLGTSNFCVNPPKGGRKGGANLESITIPERYATMLGADPAKTYKMDEVIEMMKSRFPANMEITPSLVASYLGLGAVVNPLDDDLKFYTRFSDDYKKYLKSKNFAGENLEAPGDKDGSFELWAYYQLGIPSFSMNLFTLPKVKEDKKSDKGDLKIDELEKMNPDEFSALGEDKISSFLKNNNAPERFTAKSLLEMMKYGKFSPKQLADMIRKIPPKEKNDELTEREKALLAYSDKEMGGKGFVQWQKVKHPTLGEVEIGGFVPYLETTPKPEKIDSLLKVQLPWIVKLSRKLPDITVADQKITDLGAGVYQLEVFVENKGALSYPIAMGERNKQPAPLIVLLEGDMELLEGLKRTPLGPIGANQVRKLSWLIKSDKNPVVTVKLESTVFGSSVKQIKIGG